MALFCFVLTASLLALCHASVPAPIGDIVWDQEFTGYDDPYTHYKNDLWIIGQTSHHSDKEEDRQFKWAYGRPQDPNTDYDYHFNDPWLAYRAHSGGSSKTPLAQQWQIGCFSDPPWGGYQDALFKVISKHYNDKEDREWNFYCNRLPPQFTLINCQWTGYQNSWDDPIDYQCNGLLRSIITEWNAGAYDRQWRFLCCNVQNTPINLSTAYEASRVAAELTSQYSNADGSRSISVSLWSRPNWYQRDANNPIKGTYSLTKGFSDSSFWLRVCPRNGAFSEITQNADGISFKCAEFVDAIQMTDCEWTEDINEFKADFTANCPSDGAIRGIQSYYSELSDDRKFKLYCCAFTRESYTPNTDIIIKAKTAMTSAVGIIITFDLCWNNDLYQGIMLLQDVDTEYSTDDIIKYGSCSESNVLTVSVDSIGVVNIAEITVRVNNIDYKMNLFNAFIWPLIEALPSNAFNASSYPRGDHNSMQPYRAKSSSATGWAPSGLDEPDYLQVDLGEAYSIASVSVYPRGDHNIQFVTSYNLSYSINGSSFTDCNVTLDGPQKQTHYDFIDEANSILDPQINARYLRFTPLTYVFYKTMRVEAYNGGSISMSSVAFGGGLGLTDVRIKFPDDYLTACDDTSGCSGILTTLKHSAEYLITITKCHSFVNDAVIGMQIGVILRGMNGNLDKKVLNWPFVAVTVGYGSIGALVNIHIEHLHGEALCIESVAIEHALQKDQVFGAAYFGDGVILSSDCGRRAFMRLSGIQYVPCYERVLSMDTYQASLYASVQVHSCAGDGNALAAIDSKLFSMTVVGETKANNYISSEALSLSLETNSTWEAGQSRDYTLQLSGAFAKATMVTFTNNDHDSSFCIDSVLINGVDAFLTDYWVGAEAAHPDSLRTIPAVLYFPICDIEYFVTITAETPLPTDPDSVATSTCVNRNRMLSTDCEISQRFETYEEVSWEQQIGQETLNEWSIEDGSSSSASFERGWERSVETSVGGGGVELSDSLGFSASQGRGREWSTSTSTSGGTNDIDVTTDGTVNGKTVGVDCSASVSVPPSQQIEYTMFIEQSAVEMSTLTDMKMKKCTAFLYGEAATDHIDDANDYIWVFGIKGKLVAKSATNCYVEFKQSEQIRSGGDEDSITCGKERALAAREWSTYVPQCNKADHNVYMKCQCAFGDSLTLPTCGCVDETTGNLLETEKAAVVAESDSYKWVNWCHDHCGNDSYNVAAAKAPPAIEIKNKNDWFAANQLSSVMMAVAITGIMLIYFMNSCNKWCKKQNRGYQLVETDIEKENN